MNDAQELSFTSGRVNLNAVFGSTVMSDDEGDHIHHGARML